MYDILHGTSRMYNICSRCWWTKFKVGPNVLDIYIPMNEIRMFSIHTNKLVYTIEILSEIFVLKRY